MVFISRILFTKGDDRIMDSDVVEGNNGARKPSLLTFLLLGLLVVGVVFFVFPKIGIGISGLFQKALAFIPLLRGFLPF